MLSPVQETHLAELVTVVPVAMVVPNGKGIYAPSWVRQSFPTASQNIDAVRNYSRTILVSFDEDGVSNPQPITAYGHGWSCWYIVAPGD